MSEKTIEEIVLVIVKNYRFTSLDTSVGMGTLIPEHGEFWMDDGDIYSLEQLIERFGKENIECLSNEKLKERLDKENYIEKSKVEGLIKKAEKWTPTDYKGFLNDVKKELGLEANHERKGD